MARHEWRHEWTLDVGAPVKTPGWGKGKSVQGRRHLLEAAVQAKGASCQRHRGIMRHPNGIGSRVA